MRQVVVPHRSIPGIDLVLSLQQGSKSGAMSGHDLPAGVDLT